MVYIIADNILSPLGETTDQNYQNVKSGHSAIMHYSSLWNIPEPFSASLFNDDQNTHLKRDGLSRFESIVVKSIENALSDVQIDLTKDNAVLILSTTKANIEGLNENCHERTAIYPSECAKRICREIGLKTEPIVACNACISGASAIILAARLLELNYYKYAIVSGADVLNPFVVSGFQSLKALAEYNCKPFDIERLGLNLGEAASTLILSSVHHEISHNKWHIETGAIRNDAFHISSPSKNGEGAYKAIKAVLKDVDINELALINAHGTATMFNDQMESVAIERAGLSSIPVNSLKGYFGHTLGAAGVLETVLTARSLDDQMTLGTKGFEEIGVSGHISISAESTHTDKDTFIKMISGFGGCNASLLLSKSLHNITDVKETISILKTHHVLITPERIEVDGTSLPHYCTGKEMLTELYRSFVKEYPKFYKMDMLSRLGFISTELLIEAEGLERFVPNDNRAIILFNHSSSIHTDKEYFKTIQNPDEYFPSPSLFVYTLPNIVTGEIAIRNMYAGETSFYMLSYKDGGLMEKVQKASFLDGITDSMITGWLDYENDDNFESNIYTVELR